GSTAWPGSSPACPRPPSTTRCGPPARPRRPVAVTPAIYVDPAAETENRNMVWMKTFTPLADDPALHLAALTYASDYTLLEPILRQHGVAWIQPGMSAASLDHAMWSTGPPASTSG
ncbi:acyl-CoA thioesterase II, partial [Corynebacterium diphtheriae]